MMMKHRVTLDEAESSWLCYKPRQTREGSGLQTHKPTMSEKALTNLSLLEPENGSAGDAEVKAIYDRVETSKTLESAEDQLEQKTSDDSVKKKKKTKKKKKKGVHPRQNVKVNLSDCSYPVVSRVIKYLGWSKASNKENSNWDIYWKDNG